jgi:subtilisin family serine protease
MSRRTIYLALFIGLLPLAMAASSPVAADKGWSPQHPAPPMSADCIVVKMAQAPRAASAKGPRTSAERRFEHLNSRYGVTDVTPLLQSGKRRSAAAADGTGIASIYRVRLGADADPITAAAEYAKCPGVEYAEPDYVRKAEWTPNDPYLGQQYGLTRMSAYAAWDITQGSQDIVIAVIDTGVDVNHPDLASKIVAGYDFVDSDTQPLDVYGHGTPPP